MENTLCIPVMLPTKDKASLLIMSGGRISHKNKIHPNHVDGDFNYQHLYLTSDREIKEGDWFFNKDNNLVQQFTKSDSDEGFDAQAVSDYWGGIYQKVEATTDLSLGLPLIPESFIEEYVQKQGKIASVYIQIEVVYQPQQYPLDDQQWLPTNRVKLTPYPANEVIILPIKDSFTRDEVKEIAKQAFFMFNQSNEKIFDEWFDKNY